MNRLAVDRHEIGRVRHGQHELELLLAAMTRNVHESIGLVVDLATDLRKRVDDALDGLLVAGNGSGGDDHRVVCGDGKRLVLAIGHTRERGKRLALAAGAQDNDLILGNLVDVIGVDDVLVSDAQVAKLAGDLGIGNHGTTSHHDLTTDGSRTIAHLLQTVDVAREARHEDATRRILDDVAQGTTDSGLGLGEARSGRVGRVRKQKVDPLLAELVDGMVVGTDAINGSLVELEVARVKDGSLRSAQKHTQGTRNGVRHREEVDGEAPEVQVNTVSDLLEPGRLDVVLGELALNDSERKVARVDGNLGNQILQQVRQGSGVVLVAMRDDDATELVLVLQNIGVVRKHEVDAGLIVVGEHEARVNQDHVIAALEGGHILSDAVETAERDDSQGRLLLGHAAWVLSLGSYVKTALWP